MSEVNMPNDEFSAHEALDRTFLINQTFHDFIVEHEFVKATPELAAKAEKIDELLGKLYQAIGARRA